MEAALGAGPGERPGAWIGPYRLVSKIGEGGFAIVWVAEQEQPIRRRVALKILKSGMDTKEVIARFEVERQALALMSHPNIAQVFDAGATETGRPYFALELVTGVPLTTYCDEHHLPAKDRLQLFIAVCQGVQHAHEKGVIHRDLKPSNILVALHDGVPVPKIIDFGVAKATQGRLTDRTLCTQVFQFLGTPAYSSPEQIEMNGRDVDTRSDIYSLGVVLYELLTGSLPFDADALARSGLDAVRRAICKEDPPRPSQRVRTLPSATRNTIALRHGTDAVRLALPLRGDLDWIVMRCLEKDRTRRYDSAGGLAADLHRHLRNEPVMVRVPTTAYLLRKLVQRHRFGFAAGAAIVASLLLAVALSSWSYWRERAARREAQTEAVRSAQVSNFMTTMLAGVGPRVAIGRDTTLLRDLLADTAARLETELQDHPQVAADLRQTVGTVHADLGDYPAAIAELRQALALRRKLNRGSSADLATSLDRLAWALVLSGEKVESNQLLQEALALRVTRFGYESAPVAETLLHLYSLHRAMHPNAVEEAVTEVREVLRIQRKLPRPDIPLLAFTLRLVAEAEVNANNYTSSADRFAEAERLYREALGLQRTFLGPEHPDLIDTLIQLSFLNSRRSQTDEAIAFGREALPLARKVFGPEHLTTRRALRSSWPVLYNAGRFEETLVVARELIAAERKVSGDSQQLLDYLREAAWAARYTSIDSSEESTAWLEEATEVELRLAASTGRIPGQGLSLQLGLLLGAGQAAEAAAVQERFLAKVAAVFPPGSRENLLTRYQLALTYHWYARCEPAVPLAEEAWQGLEASSGPDDFATLQASVLLGRIMIETGRAEEGIARLYDVHRRIRKWDTPDQPDPVRLWVDLARGLGQAGRISEARDVLEELLLQSRPSLGPAPDFEGYVLGVAQSDARRDGWISLAHCLLLLGEDEGVETALLESLPTNYHIFTFMRNVHARVLLATWLVGRGRLEEAEPLLRESFRYARTWWWPVKNHEELIPAWEAAKQLVSLYEQQGKWEEAAEWIRRRDAWVARVSPATEGKIIGWRVF